MEDRVTKAGDQKPNTDSTKISTPTPSLILMIDGIEQTGAGGVFITLLTLAHLRAIPNQKHDREPVLVHPSPQNARAAFVHLVDD